MSEPFETSTDGSQEVPAPPKKHWAWVVAKVVALISGGVGMGLTIVLGVLAFLLFVVAPWFLDQIYKLGS